MKYNKRYDILLKNNEYKIYGDSHTIDNENKLFIIYNEGKIVTYIAFDYMIITIRDKEYLKQEAEGYAAIAKRQMENLK